MIIALLGDVHANLPALEAVLTHAQAHGAEQIWNIGDFLGYGAYPNEVVQRLRQVGATSILGNYDIKVLHFPKKEKRWRKSKRPEKYLAFEWAHQELSKENRRYLLSLPEEIRLQLAGRRILLTHASPASNEEHLYPETPQDRLVELAEQAQADIIIFGHSHRHFARTVAETLFINTGSVGRPDDGDPRACYALLEISEAVLQVRHVRLEYDLERAVSEIRRRGLPEAFAQMILQGRDLDNIVMNAS
jgi:putative phosphoesterase